MRSSARARRAKDIETIALVMLYERGFNGLTMSDLARRAKASNETLYRWYGDKDGLYKALIQRNAQRVADALTPIEGYSAADTLRRLGPVLLDMLLGPEAVALNRAAAADATGVLGACLSESGRGTVGPWIAQVMAKGLENGEFTGGTAKDLAESYITLLVGDLQVRRVTHAMPEPDKTTIKQRSETAFLQFSRLYPSAGTLDESDSAP